MSFCSEPGTCQLLRDFSSFPTNPKAGTYMIGSKNGVVEFIGDATNIQKDLKEHYQSIASREKRDSLLVQFFPSVSSAAAVN